jgi:predicted amidohydrolase
MAKRTLKLAMAQMGESADLGRNLRRIGEMAREAASKGARLAVFPECALTGYGPACHRSAAEFDAEAVAAAVEELRGVAREARLTLVAGAHLPGEGGWTNSILLFTPGGRAPARYDKVHLYGRDAEFYRAGRKRPDVVRTPAGRLGMQNCFDIRFPELYRGLALRGAELLLTPAHIHGRADMWKGPVIEGHMRSRAAENGRFVVFVNTAGAAQNVPSMTADPRGCLAGACRPRREEVALVEIDLGLVNDAFLRCRREELYGGPGAGG